MAAHNPTRVQRIDRSPDEIFLTSAQLISIFGASITFALIVGSNAPPVRFTDQTVRDLLTLAWVSFSLALIMATMGQWVAAVRAPVGGDSPARESRECGYLEILLKYCGKFIQEYGKFVIGSLLLAPCFLLGAVSLAYSAAGWVAINSFAIVAPVVLATFIEYGSHKRWGDAGQENG